MRSKLLADAIGLIFFLALPMPAFAFATDVVLYYFLGNIFRIFGLHCWIYIFAFNKKSNIRINLDNKRIFLCLL